jgi:hypothetical protein
MYEKMDQLKGPELRERQARLQSQLWQLVDQIWIESDAHKSKITMCYRNGFTLHLTVDRQGAPTLYYFFDDGTVDVDADSSETVAAQRAERQRRVDRLVAKALKRHGVSAHIAAR